MQRFAVVLDLGLVSLLRKSPASLPVRRSLLGWLCVATFCSYHLGGVSWANLLFALDLLLALSVPAVLLSWVNLRERWLQTATAWMGCNLWISLVAALLSAINTSQSVGALSSLFLAIWSMVAVAHILCKALEWPFARALILSLFLHIGTLTLLDWASSMAGISLASTAG